MKEKIKYKAIYNDNLTIDKSNQHHDFSGIEEINGSLLIKESCTKAIDFKSLKRVHSHLSIYSGNKAHKFPVLERLDYNLNLHNIATKLTFPALTNIAWDLTIQNAKAVVCFPVLELVKYNLKMINVTVAPRFPKLREISRHLSLESVSTDVKLESLEDLDWLEVSDSTSSIKLNALTKLRRIEVTACKKNITMSIPKIRSVNTVTISETCNSLRLNSIKHIHHLNLKATVNPHSFNGLENVGYLNLEDTRASHSFKKLKNIERDLGLKLCRKPQKFSMLQHIGGTLDLRDNKAVHIFKRLVRTGDIDLARNIAPFDFKTLKTCGRITIKRTSKEYKFNALVKAGGIFIDKYDKDIKFPVLAIVEDSGIHLEEVHNKVEFPALTSSNKIVIGNNVIKPIVFPVLKSITRSLYLTRCHTTFEFPVLNYAGDLHLNSINNYDFSSLTNIGFITISNSKNIKFDNKALKIISGTTIQDSSNISIKHVVLHTHSLLIRKSINVSMPSLQVVQALELFSDKNVDISNLYSVSNNVDISHMLSHLDLSKLKYIKGDLFIFDTDYIADETCCKTNELCHIKLDSLEYVLGHTRIKICKAIIDIPTLTLIGKSLQLASLDTTPLLESLTHVNGDVEVSDIHYHSLLNSLEYTAGSLKINNVLLNPVVVSRLYYSKNSKGNYDTVVKHKLNDKISALDLDITNKVLDIYIKFGYLYVDDICAKIKSKKGNMYKCTTIGDDESIVYVVSMGSYWAHGKTLRDANNDVKFKMSKDKGKEVYNNLKLTSKKTLDDWKVCYRVITGACAYGVARFIDNNLSKEDIANESKLYTLKKVIDITANKYGHDCFVTFFQEAIHTYNDSKKKSSVA